MNRKMIHLPNVAISQRTTPKDQLSKKSTKRLQQCTDSPHLNCLLPSLSFFLLFDGRKKECECQTFRASRLIELNNTRYDLHCRVLRNLCRENGKAMNNLPAFASKKVFSQVLDKQGEQT